MKSILIFFGSILIAISCYAQQNGINVKGKIENPKGKSLIFRKNGANALTGERERTRYKAIINQKNEFEIFLPNTEISEWVIEVEDLFLLVDFGAKGNFNIKIQANNAYNISVSDEFGNDFNFQSYAAKIVSTKFDYDKLKTLTPLEALKFRKEKAAFQLQLLSDYQKSHQMDKDYLDWLIINYQYEPYERSLVEDRIELDSLTMLSLIEKGIDNDFAAKHSENYNMLIKYYVHYKFNKLSFPLKIIEVFDFGAKNLAGLTKQVYLTHHMITLSKSPDSIYNLVYAKYNNEVTDETLISLAKNERKKYLLALEASKMSKEDISEYNSLNEIFKKYKGKVIYVDFWASWCGPCKSEMPKAANLKEKLRGKEVVFIYFAYKDVKENWLSARKELEIEGEHYLLNSKLIMEANTAFEITGIPHYVIIGKDGSIVDKSALRPNNVYQQLLKLSENK